MMNAKELWKITENTLNEKATERKNKAMKALETTIYPRMEKSASQGEYAINCHIDEELDIDTIIDALTEADYDVKKSGRSLRIAWFYKR
mgnify:CR=1 FL=1